ncbi:MAG: hypothetical protein RL708_2655 [Bacteroidota bacterium]|jgi:hypothetical protein
MQTKNIRIFLIETALYTAIILGFYFLYFNPNHQNEKPKSKVPFVYQQF